MSATTVPCREAFSQRANASNSQVPPCRVRDTRVTQIADRQIADRQITDRQITDRKLASPDRPQSRFTNARIDGYQKSLDRARGNCGLGSGLPTSRFFTGSSSGGKRMGVNRNDDSPKGLERVAPNKVVQALEMDRVGEARRAPRTRMELASVRGPVSWNAGSR